ncbi:MAG: YcxB family protein [Bacteroidota bacterium]
MKISYTLTEEDFLQHQLYLASQSQRIRKKEQRTWKLLSFAFSALGVTLLFTGTASPAGPLSILFAGLTVFFYPAFVKRRYVDHYRNHIRENYQNRVGHPSDIELREDHLFMKDKTGEGKIKLEELEKLVETRHYYFLRLKSGPSIIFPKTQIQDLAAFRKSFEDLSIPILPDMDWEKKFVGLPNFFAKSSAKN